jgi:hypothetical protein
MTLPVPPVRLPLYGRNYIVAGEETACAFG